MSNKLQQNRIPIAIAINVVITIAEITVGALIGSLAIISDAIHNFFDIGSMGLSWFGEKVAEKPNDLKKSYGYKRVEILIALANSSILFVSVSYIAIESIKRLISPEPANGSWIVITALIAFIGNSIATKLLHNHSEDNLNLKSAFLHSLQDALFSLGVVVAGIGIVLLKWNFLDPLISIVLSILILKEAITLILKTVNILMESVPENIDLQKMKSDILGISSVLEVNDLHVWQTGSNNILMSGHVVANVSAGSTLVHILGEIKQLLSENYGIDHSTIQLVTKDDYLQLNCQHCS